MTPYDWEAEERRDSERFYTGPDDPDRPDPSEYMDDDPARDFDDPDDPDRPDGTWTDEDDA